jgi:hypothetical protein
MTATLTAPSEAETRVFGPRPPIVPAVHEPAIAPRRTLPRRWLLIAIALVSGIGAIALLRPTTRPSASPSAAPSAMASRQPCPAPSAPPAGATTMTADVDGDGCAELFIRVLDIIERVGGPSAAKFSIGRADDVVVLGDWDCDGRATPALYRPGAGRAWIFDSWATSSEPVSPARSLTASKPPTTPRCGGPRGHARA